MRPLTIVYAKPKSEHQIGLVFDPEFYQHALQIYDERHRQIKAVHDPRLPAYSA